MLSSKRLNLLAALADQAWLSLLNFVVSLAFIWGASKTEYGAYILLMAPILLVQSIQNAVVSSPLATLLPAASESRKPKFMGTATYLNIQLALACGVLGGVGLLAYGQISELYIDGLLLTGFVLAILGTVARESQRSFAYVNRQGVRALVGDILYGVVLLTGIAFALKGDRLSASLVLLFTGVAGLTPLVMRISSFQGLRVHRETISEFWSCGRWALPSVIVTWINLSSYPYFARHALGLPAVADIGASRLILMPIGVLITAWSNWFRPQISAWLAGGNVEAVVRITTRSLYAGWGLLTVLAAVLVMAYPHVEEILGEEYKGLQPLVLMWLLFFALSLARNVLMATLMTDAGGYKILHHITWIGLVLCVPGFVLFAEKGVLWVVGVLCAVELAQLLMVTLKARHYWRRVRAQN